MALPLPDIMAARSFLFVGPHPDDIEVGCGGLVSRLARAGKEIYFLVVTDGGSGSFDLEIDRKELISIRMQEASASMEFLGGKAITFLDFPDGGDYRDWDVAKRIAEVIIDCDPDFVFAPDPLMPSEIHPDHLRSGKAAETALMMASFPLIFQENLGYLPENHRERFRSRSIALYYTHRPNRYVKVAADDITRQQKAIEIHKSQFPSHDDLSGIYRYLKIRGKSFGSLGKNGREGYFVRGSMHQHCFPEVNFY